MARPFLLGIAGGSASGKSTLAAHVAAALHPLSVAIVPEDSYYFSVPGGKAGDGKPFNFDRPETKDFALLALHLTQARAGEAFDMPHYDFATHTRQAATTRIAPADVLILEGMHHLGDARLRAIADLTVHIDCGEEVRRTRRVTRDVAERQREAAATEAQFAEVVAPMHDLHVEPNRIHAAFIVENAGCDPAVLTDAAAAIAARVRTALATR